MIDPAIVQNEINRYKERYIRACDAVKCANSSETPQLINVAETYDAIIQHLEKMLNSLL